MTPGLWAAIAAGSLIAAGVCLLAAVGFFRRARRQLDGYLQASRATEDVHELMRQLETMAECIDGRVESRVEELCSATERAQAVLAELRTTPQGPMALGQYEGEHPLKGEPEDRGFAPGGRTAVLLHSDRAAEICSLSDRGFDNVEIARRLGVPVGEIELTLGLTGKQRVK